MRRLYRNLALGLTRPGDIGIDGSSTFPNS